jgi:transposase-like protein
MTDFSFQIAIALQNAEADQLCGARKYERSEGRKATRAGSYDNDKLAVVARVEG